MSKNFTTPLFSCGHPRTEKGKKFCPACRADRDAKLAQKKLCGCGRPRERLKHLCDVCRAERQAGKARTKSDKQKAAFAARRQAALERIGKAVNGATSRDQVAERLGGDISRQRISQLIRYWEKATGQTVPLIGTKPGIPRKNRPPKPHKVRSDRNCNAPLPESGRFCRRRKGHFGPHSHWVSWSSYYCGQKDQASGWVCNRKPGHYGKHRYVAEVADGPRLLEWFDCPQCKDSKLLKCYVALELCDNCPPNMRADFMEVLTRRIVKALGVEPERIEVTQVSQRRLHLACDLDAAKTGEGERKMGAKRVGSAIVTGPSREECEAITAERLERWTKHLTECVLKGKEI